MRSSFHNSYRKSRRRRLLVLSAGGETSSVQCLYLAAFDGGWEILSSASVPYAGRIGSLLESCRRQAVSVDDLAWLEYKISQLFVECANNAVATLPRSLRKPHLIVLNQLALFKGSMGDHEPVSMWNLAMGDPVFCARALNTPVISDIVRFHLLNGGGGTVPMLDGNRRIVNRFSGMVGLLNLGLIAHMSIIDHASGCMLADSDTGPGMCLINRCAREMRCPEGFDRDGSEAAKGTVDVACLDGLATAPWFLMEGPKEAHCNSFDHLLQKPELMALQPHDRLAVVTALTARTIYDFYRMNYHASSPPEAVVLSGGGANNLELLKYLKTYFGRIPLVNGEELGIPLEMRVPLSIGLSVDALLLGNGIEDKREPIGRLTLP